MKKQDIGLLILRVCVGITMIMHGLPKFLGGSAVLTSVGQAVSVYGIVRYPLAWGFAAATVEVFGGLMIILGLLFRSASFALFCVMLTALLSLNPQLTFESFGVYAHAFVMMGLFLSLILIGPGEYCLAGKALSKGSSRGSSKGSSKGASKSSKGEEQ
jgi:putative oxidoreductase